MSAATDVKAVADEREGQRYHAAASRAADDAGSEHHVDGWRDRKRGDAQRHHSERDLNDFRLAQRIAERAEQRLAQCVWK